MENLYHQTPSLTVRPDYQAALIELCVSILEYFGLVAVKSISLGNEVQENSFKESDELFQVIKDRNAKCQKFSVAVEPIDADLELSNVNREVEDISDDMGVLM